MLRLAGLPRRSRPAARGRNAPPRRRIRSHAMRGAKRSSQGRLRRRRGRDRLIAGGQTPVQLVVKDLWGTWWCRLDSNQRQRDYESRALPPELRHRHRRNEMLARGLRPRLRLALLVPVLGYGHSLSLVHTFLCIGPSTNARRLWVNACGGRIARFRARRSILTSLGRLPVPGNRRLRSSKSQESGANLAVQRVFQPVLIGRRVDAGSWLRP